MARKIEVELVGDSRSLERAFGRTQAAGGKLGKAVGTGLKVAAGVGIAALGGLGVAAKIGFDEFNQGQKVAAQTNAVLKSTGRVAKVSAKDVSDLAEALMKKTGIDDEVIASGQNVLLTFTQIRNEVGKGNDVFNQATKAALDMSVALGTDMQSAVILVGKALNDPIRGLTALRRVGVSFTKQQEEQIKKLVESGETMKAQKLILEELRKEFGGSAKAAGETFAGQINVLRESFNNWAGDMVGKVMPTLQDFAERLAKAGGFRAKFKVAFTGVKSAAQRVWDDFADLITGTSEARPLKLKTGKIIEWQQPAAGLADQIKEGIKDVNWAEIGRIIGDNVSSKVKITAEFIGEALDAANAYIDAHIDEFASLGAKMALKIIDKLLDPKFWAENWQLILGIAIAVFPLGRVAKLGGMVGRFLARPLVKAFHGIVNRLPTVLGLAAIGMVKVLGKFIGWVTQRLGILFREQIPGWIRTAFRLAAVLAFWNGLQDIYGRIRKATVAVIEAVRNLWAKVPGYLNPVRVAFFRVLGPIQLAIAAVQRLIDWISRIPSPGDVARGFGNAILPGNPFGRGAAGGIVTRPTLSLIGEAGPEAVIPLNRMPGARPLAYGRAGGPPGEFAIIRAAPDVLRWLEDLQRTSRRSGRLA